MNQNAYDEVKRESVRELEERFGLATDTRKTKNLIDEAVGKAMAARIEAGTAYVISEEEISMLKAFRKFKATCKPGETFRWSTRPEEKKESGND